MIYVKGTFNPAVGFEKTLFISKLLDGVQLAKYIMGQKGPKGYSLASAFTFFMSKIELIQKKFEHCFICILVLTNSMGSCRFK